MALNYCREIVQEAFSKERSVGGIIGRLIGLIIACALVPSYLERSHRTHYGNPTDPIIIKIRQRDLQVRHSKQFKYSERVKLYNYAHYKTPEILHARELNRR